MKTWKLPIREKDRGFFDALVDATKTVETRAAGPKYEGIRSGDKLEFVCGSDRLVKTVYEVKKFPSLNALFKNIGIQKIMPALTDLEKAKKTILAFPGYNERIKKYGITAFVLTPTKKLKLSKSKKI